MFESSDLERIDRDIAEAMRRAARLRGEIAHRELDGGDVTCAISLLKAFVVGLNGMIDRRENILKDLGN